MIEVRDVDGGASLRVRVVPRASRDEVGGERGGALLVWLTAPPVEGAANAALARVLARRLGVPPSSVAIVRGATGRDKRLVVSGLSATDVLSRLAKG